MVLSITVFIMSYDGQMSYFISTSTVIVVFLSAAVSHEDLVFFSYVASIVICIETFAFCAFKFHSAFPSQFLVSAWHYQVSLLSGS